MRVLIAVFLLVCISLLIPARHYVSISGTELQAPQPAGEITAPFRLRQEVRNPISAAEISPGDEMCVGLRFATYRRRMVGQFAVTWRQGNFAKRWLVNTPYLRDNKFSYFCPGEHFKPAEEFSILIEGMDGVSGSSATVWLTTDASLGRAEANGRSLERGLSLQIAREVRMTPAKLIRLDHGAFLIGWLCTLLTGLAVLLWLRQNKSAEFQKDLDAKLLQNSKIDGVS